MRKTKNIELSYHYIQEKIQCGTIIPHDIETSKNPADGFTKALDKMKFQEFRNLLGVHLHKQAKLQEYCQATKAPRNSFQALFLCEN